MRRVAAIVAVASAVAVAGCVPAKDRPPLLAGCGAAKLVVPNGVSQVMVYATGAQGGAGADNGVSPGGAGGLGADAIAVVPVRPGLELPLFVGCAGTPGTATGGGIGGLGDSRGGNGGFGPMGNVGGGGGGGTALRVSQPGERAGSMPAVYAGGGGAAGFTPFPTAFRSGVQYGDGFLVIQFR